jgi:uncharacterized RDD family membrane protein YckC
VDKEMAKYCPSCGHKTEPDSIYCLNCGKKLPEKTFAEPGARWEAPTQHSRPVSYQSPGYKAVYQPRPFHPSMKAPLGERIIASLIDSAIASVLSYVCIGIFYGCFQDGIRDGQSFGKGILNLRVVDYISGTPATLGQSCVRNCICGWVDVMCCYLTVFVSDEGRRIGDQVAGTVVIRDQ